MGRLIIVAGASGAGKSYFVHIWKKNDPNAVDIKKYVGHERAPREREIRTGETDLVFSARYDPDTAEGQQWYKNNYPGLKPHHSLKYHNNTYDFTNTGAAASIGYWYANTYYEIDMNALRQAMKTEKNPIVIVRDIHTIRTLLGLYPDALVLYMVSALSGEDLRNSLSGYGEMDIDIQDRLNRAQTDLKSFSMSLNLLPSYKIIPNDYKPMGESAFFYFIMDVYEKEVRNYTRSKGIFLIQSYKNNDHKTMVRNAINSAFMEVFAKMPTYEVADAKSGYTFPIPAHVWSCVRRADYVICDITNDRCNECPDDEKRLKQGTSANVWLELGGAIAQNKNTIIICKSDAKGKEIKLPTDLQGYRYVAYQGEHELTEALKLELREASREHLL